MNLYQKQHPFYCGIDLHANKMYVCVVDHRGKKRLHRNFHTRDTHTFLQSIEPFARQPHSLVVGCESTFSLSVRLAPGTGCAIFAKNTRLSSCWGLSSCWDMHCTSKRSTAERSKTTKSTLRNWRICCAAATLPSATLTRVPGVRPATCCEEEPTTSVAEARR